MNFVEELRDDFLICNICFEEYRDPKQLPCLHTFCRGCLLKYITGKIAETGADWFPCPFCRKPIQPELRGEGRTWADSFPTNFFLSQLSSKLQTLASSGHMSNSVFNGEITAKAMCTKHAKMALVAYCTQKRRSVCEECCVQTHLDCIQYHESERDSRAISDERKLKLKQDFDLLKIRLEGLMDKVNCHVTELNSKKEQLQLQTEAAVSEVRTKLELMVLEQKRELGRQLDMLVDRERRRLSGVKERALEVSQAFDKMAETLANVEGGACSTLDGLTALDDVEEELKKQEQVMESTRKDSALSEIVFYPDKTFEPLFRKLTFGTLSLERKPQDSSGARPRTHRYSSDPNSYSSPLDPRDSVILLQQRSVAGDEAWDDVSLSLDPSFSSQKERIARRGFSPPGAAASAPASATPSGATTVESVSTDHMRQKLDVPKNSKPPFRRSPTSPDFGSTVPDKAKSRSRSLPRRRRPRSEGAFPPGARRRHALQSVDDERDFAHGRRSSEKSCFVSPSPTVVYDNDTPGSKFLPRSSYNDSGDNSKNGGAVYTSEEEFSSLGSEASQPPLAGATSGSRSPANSPAPPPYHIVVSDGDQARAPKIVCVRNFLATHQSDIKNMPGVVGLTAVCRDRVVVTDRWNKCLKLVDIVGGRVLDVMCFSEDTEPWDVALRKSGVLAVTYPKEQKIRMVDVAFGGSRMLYRSHFTTRDGYASLATYSPTSLVASVCPPFGNPKVHVIDYMGVILRAIDCATVAYPRCVDMCGGGEICVSDWTNHDVKIFTRENTLKHTYSGVSGSADTMLKAPMGLCWDGHANVFVVDGKTARLHVVSTETGQCSVIFSLAEVSDAEMKLVTFVDASPDLCQSERALIVTTTTGAIQVYDFQFRRRGAVDL